MTGARAVTRREFNRLAATTLGGLLAPAFVGCGTLDSFMGITQYYGGVGASFPRVSDDPTLPAEDPAPAARRAALAAVRAEYQYNHEYLAPVPLLDEVPDRERFSHEYVAERVLQDRREIASRGLDDRDALPDFAYRDDGELVWNAIHTFVSRYLALYYRDDQRVVADTELAAWADELASPRLGRVRDMPSPITSLEQLGELVTNILFTCGPQHAAVNYPQYGYVAFVPNMPLASYTRVPDPASPTLEEDLMRFLPTKRLAKAQLELMDALTNYRYDRLGTYASGAFRDTRALSLVHDFEQQLRLVERQIDERNAQRLFPYVFPQPSNITNSTSI